MSDKGEKTEILIIEDDDQAAADLERRLIGLGYTVRKKADFSLGINEPVELGQPDLIVTNGANGVVINEAGSTGAGFNPHGIPIVFLVGGAEAGQIDRREVKHPFYCLFKPLDDQDLKIKIEMALHASWLEKERIAAEEAFQESEEKYRELYNHVPAGIFEIDLIHNRLVDANYIACQQLGYSREQLLETDIYSLFNEESRKMFARQLERCRQGEEISGQVECEMIRKSGQRWWALMTVRYRNINSGITGASVVVTDISKRKLMENLARKNEERFRLIANNSVDSAFFHDQELKYIWITKAFSPFTIERILGKTDLTLWGEEYGRNLFQFKIKVLEQKNRMQSEFVLPMPDGGLSYYEITCSPRTNLGGEVIGLSGFMRDITARRKAEEEIHHREELLRIERKNLEEANAAFRQLLKHRDQDILHQKEDLLQNIKNRVFPYLQRLKSTKLDESQRDLIDIIENSLASLMPGFSAHEMDVLSRLTPKELEVANLITMGQSSKKIAELFGVSAQTVAFHRKNIRKKLKLKEKGQNLRSYLMKLGRATTVY